MPIPGGMPPPEVEQVEEAVGFFKEWQLYSKVLAQNYLYHREVYAQLHEFLVTRLNRPFTLLDLGCGDAGFVARARWFMP